MNERMKFEAWLRSIWTAGYDCRRGPGGDSYASGEAQNYWTAWQAAIASQAPRQALSDAEIGKLWKDLGGDNYPAATRFARAIIAASGPNAALVAALRETLRQAEGWYDECRGADASGLEWHKSAVAALAAVGVEP